MTTLAAWSGVDPRGPSSLYLVSDSRISWGSYLNRWDAGRKLFACKSTPDVFGYVGDVLFPSLMLGQIIAAADDGALFPTGASAEARHAIVAETVKVSLGSRFNAPDRSFAILHGARDGSGMNARFRLWTLTYVASTWTRAAVWTDEELSIDKTQSALHTALGSGGRAVKKQNEDLQYDPQGRTSRAIFWAFCDALKNKADPLSGGAPQLIGLYRTEMGKSYGITYEGHRYYQGLLVPDSAHLNGIEWRDVNFQRVDGATMQVLHGAQRHGRR
ncbi:hypothetical protein IVB41_34365 [Bradyrhizobium sp. 44]|uniref:hypothetical protein n=1 Tax=unclassified Bradyrhizobium TaxID=2631580 RepID=UPI001FFAFEE6|nr:MULTISPECIES: hypothetical protein [unclassified Bradyrhizobium]MCK1288989.1 hypothetical protein [Bradyrhizobium sp. 44]UPJ43993.1 hypothetical protein IVB40_08000 [Bradyrhizobium sp. 40]